jgi:hypothetical protein
MLPTPIPMPASVALPQSGQRLSTAVLLSTLLASLAELAPLGQARMVLSLFAPMLGYAWAYLIHRAVGTYEYNQLCRQSDKLIYELRAQAKEPNIAQTRKEDLEQQMDDLFQLKHQALLQLGASEGRTGL